ncbi:hypothetical protein CCACVL1_07866 [Corchorus capsularis]|uniref:Uncharacterized protein n=1 Tax=Corchorus capsularis TaxID=210143 RepID=A0A1R3J3I3_COCAP|nr:hypothetical protein CCACVL1_07866 [Corchorus capsularis]
MNLTREKLARKARTRPRPESD